MQAAAVAHAAAAAAAAVAAATAAVLNRQRIPNLHTQVGFHSDALVKKAHVARRLNEIVNRLNKTQARRLARLRQGPARNWATGGGRRWPPAATAAR